MYPAAPAPAPAAAPAAACRTAEQGDRHRVAPGHDRGEPGSRRRPGGSAGSAARRRCSRSGALKTDGSSRSPGTGL